jgi:4-hydroxybenzoate polyprenyltransferase
VAAVPLIVLMLPESATAYAPQLKRYPYLTDVVGSSATVSWAWTLSGSSTSGAAILALKGAP